MSEALLEDADWPLFGWADDIRPALRRALEAGRPVALATLFKVEGSAPRGAGAQMLFDGAKASGYFSGDCIEGDVARHAAEVLADGVPRHLHYGMGSPWIDIRLRCGGALHILVERIDTAGAAARDLLGHAGARRQCIWSSDGKDQKIIPGDGPLLAREDSPLRIARRYDPPRRLIVSGGDPGALALARLSMEAQLETVLIRPDGPEGPPPFPVSRYLREEPAEALAAIGLDSWTAYVGATHEDHHDLAACLYALRHGAAYVAMIGAKVRAEGRLEALAAAGASQEELARLHLSPGIPGLGKAPWEVAIGIFAQLLQAMNPARERA
ncbi:MAG: XdhC family protein [Novosphingobium sp.]